MRGGGMRHYHGSGGRGRKLILGYKHSAVTVPSSTEKIIIFPVDRTKGKFSLQFYDPAMTKGRIQREEIERFFEELDPMVKPIFNTKMNSFLKCYQTIYPFLAIAIIIGFLVGMFMGIRSETPYGFFIGPAIFMAFWLSLVAILIINCSHVAGIKRKMDESKAKIVPLMIARNPEFQRKGYFWVSPNNFPYWIELWVNDAPQMMTIEQQYGIPMREQVPYYYHPVSNSNQVSPMYYSP